MFPYKHSFMRSGGKGVKLALDGAANVVLRLKHFLLFLTVQAASLQRGKGVAQMGILLDHAVQVFAVRFRQGIENTHTSPSFHAFGIDIPTRLIVTRMGLTFQFRARTVKVSCGSSSSLQMQRSKWPLALGGALLLYALYNSQITQPNAAPSPAQPAPVRPAPKPKPRKPDNPCPNCPHKVMEQKSAPSSKAPQLGGIVSPDGTSRTIVLPDVINWPKNIASRGLGCCGFRAVDYLARLQNVPALVDWPEQLRQDGVAGGAYPQKVETLIERYAPDTPHWQDTTKSHAVLAASIASERGVAVDYSGHDPHYNGSIAHCVTCIAFDAENDWVAIIDNNYPSLDEIVWMSIAEFDKRWGGWAYGLLAQTPGYCVGQCGAEAWDFYEGANGVTNYGLTRKDGNFGRYIILNGEESTTEAILESIGPAMMPVPHLPIDVDHKIDLSDLKSLAVFVGGGLLIYYLMTQEKS